MKLSSVVAVSLFLCSLQSDVMSQEFYVRSEFVAALPRAVSPVAIDLEDMASNREAPKAKTIQSWKKEFSWLEVENNALKCLFCCKWEEKIRGTKNYSDAFIKGSTNFRKSSVSDHSKSCQHLRSIELNEKSKCEEEGRKYQKKINVVIPPDAPIYQGLKKMSDRKDKYKFNSVDTYDGLLSFKDVLLLSLNILFFS